MSKIYLVYYGNTIKHTFLDEKVASEVVSVYNNSGGNGHYWIKIFEVNEWDELLEDPKFLKRFKKAMMNILGGI